MASPKGFALFSALRKRLQTEQKKYYKRLPNAWEIMTGKERWQAVQYAKGNTDPFFIFPLKRGPGTKDCPNIIPSVYDKRIVGCLCTEDCSKIKYWWIHEGFPRRCDCNYWFVLERFEMPKIYDDCP